MRFSTIVIRNLLRRKVRSLLTILGIAIGVGTTVALLNISEGFRRITVDSLIDRGVDLVVVEKDAVDQVSSDVDARVLPLVKQIPGVREVCPTLADLAAFEVKRSTVNVLIQGWEPGNLLFDALQVTDGRSLQAGESSTVMLGTLLAGQLQKKAGDSIEILGEPFQIVGVYESFSLPENAGLVMSLSEMQRVMVNEGRITGFGVALDPQGADLQAVRTAINDLQFSDGRSARIHAESVRDYAKSAMHLRVSRAMALVTSAIAVFVGAIGILNTMIMSVVERIREISLLRAIGWKRSRVTRMVVGESVALSLLGSAVGVVAAYLLVQLLTRLPETAGLVDGQMTWYVVMFGVAMAGVVGLIGGIYPALRAANLPPSHGLRSE